MPYDKVRLLKIENPSEGGTQTDWGPTEIDVTEDYAVVKGVIFENNDSFRVDTDGVNALQLSDIDIAFLKLREFGNPNHNNTLFVSPSGDDTIANGSTVRPYQTIAAAVAAAVGTTTIYLIAGVYTEPTIALSNEIILIGAGSGNTVVQNGFSYVAAAAENTALTVFDVNVNTFTVDVSAAANGTITMRGVTVAMDRDDNNPNVVWSITESIVSVSSVKGGTNTINETLIIGNITLDDGILVAENCKIIARFEILDNAVLRTLDCSLFVATEYVNGTNNTATPTWQTDFPTLYFGSYTGTVNRVVLTPSNTSSLIPYDDTLVPGVEWGTTVQTALDGAKQIDASTQEPTGMVNRTDSILSFSDATRIVTLAPAVSSFDYFIKGTKYTISTSKTVTLPNTSGNYFIYMDDTETLQYQLSFDISLFTGKAYISYIYWDATNGKATTFAEERHGIVMDGSTHSYLHTTRGTQLVSGAAITYTLGTGSLDADAQVAISDGQVRDEDIVVNFANSATPTNPFEQVLSPIAKIPIFYRSGASLWVKSTASNFPMLTGPNRTYYNELVAGSWQLTEAPSNNKVCVTYIFTTTDIRNPVIGILGQAQYQNVDEAKTLAAWDQISFGDLPAQELKLCYILYYETSSAYANTPKAKIVFVSDTRFNVDRQVSATVFNGDHSNLSGLSNDDHTQYLLVSGLRAMTGALDMGSHAISNITQLNTTTSTELSYLNNVTSDIQNQLDAKLDDSQLGAANGVASLDSATRLPASQLTILRLQAGTVASGSFAGNPKKATVTFPIAFLNTSYTLIPIGLTDVRTFTIESKTTTTAVINTNSNQALTGSIDWIALPYGSQ